MDSFLHSSRTPAPRFTRRQFLQALAALGLGAVGFDALGFAAETTGPRVGWMDLCTGLTRLDSSLAPPHGMPGSLMKLVAVALICEEKLISPAETMECRGMTTIRGATVHCQTAHGRVSLVEALGVSCNGYFAHAAELISPSLFLEYARRFQLDQPAAGFPAGAFPKRRALQALEYVLGLSPGLQPNLLQLLRLGALIAGRGNAKPLRLSGRSKLEEAPSLQFSKETWTLLERGMRLCGRAGTAAVLDPSDKYRLAVKTGTTPHGETYQSWIMGYFPFEAPRYAFCLRALKGTSRDAAVPLARRFLESKKWP